MTQKKHDLDEEELKHEERLRQALLIQKLATRLPWLVMGISLLAFLIIFVEIAYFRK